MKCASSPKLTAMIPQQITVFKSSGKTLMVEKILGGKETSQWSGSKINATDFRLALIESLKKHNIFSSLISDGIADYILSATIASQDQPLMGFNMTTNLIVAYVIKKTDTGEEIYNKKILSSYTATVGEAFVGVTRLRIANEGAARENIKLFLQDISKMQF